ncbi:glycosyltransferase [Nocardioides sp. zg-1230]|uniref:glycosyltransferase n=1 Tax=Nocardioides sp. zg-1230 TaxID=2736601 RepID=UPI00155326C1|nr:glycosyltransferase family 2 protein [Nocardioides sp. zg-1230]
MSDAEQVPDESSVIRVAIGICTHRRLEGLKSLLVSIAALDVPARSVLRVIVVDNDSTGSAEAALPQDFPLQITYAIEKMPGIPAARSRCVALAENDDYILFVDDDERVAASWVVEMLASAQEEAADGVGGLVAYEYDSAPPRWIAEGGFFDAPATPHRAVIPFAATNNLLLHVPTLHRLGVTTFDGSLQFSGGSDVELTSRLVRAGARLVWHAHPLVTETVPAERISIRWCLKRAIRTGEGVARLRVGSFTPTLPQRLFILVLGLAKVGGAFPALGVGALQRNPAVVGRAVRGGMRGIGMARFAFGRRGAEYASRHESGAGVTA